ncbi:MAG: S-layer homology domain-containing protein, partial [Oscillospiraceae bacterium]|nr:S-layer homology domain-containing protein [Oscillospiraceae bacterium]
MKRKLVNRVLSAAVAAVLLTVSVTGLGAPLTAKAAYADTIGHWAQVEINRWTERGIITGTNNMFRPDDPLTRGELAVIVDRIFKWRLSLPNGAFSDVAQGGWYSGAVLRAGSAGVIQGANGYMRPNDYVQRQEAAVILGRALNITASSAANTNFNDDYQIAAWAKGIVKELVSRGAISADGVGGGRFAPLESLTRAQFVKMLDNAISDIYSEQGGYSQYASKTVIINASGVTLSNMTIQGDLVISEGVGDGGVELKGVTVSGTVYVKGGRRTIEIVNSSITNMVVNRAEGETQIRVDGTSNIYDTRLFTTAILTENNAYSNSGFRNVTIDEGAVKDIRVDILGDTDNVYQNANNADLRINGKVGTLTIGKSCNVKGDITYDRINFSANVTCTINGEKYSPNDSNDTADFRGVTISPSGAVYVSDTLRAVPAGGTYASYSYRWFWSNTNLAVNDSGWYQISGETYSTYKIASQYNGADIMVEVNNGWETYRAKTGKVGSGLG